MPTSQLDMQQIIEDVYNASTHALRTDTSVSVGTVQIEDTTGGSITVGQKAMAASLPVVVASNQTAIPVTSTQLTTPSTAINNQVTVTTAGTRVRVIVASTTITSVVIKALAANTGKIYVGDSTVSSANGFELSARDAISISVDNLNKVWIDSTVNGEKVCYIAS